MKRTLTIHTTPCLCGMPKTQQRTLCDACEREEERAHMRGVREAYRLERSLGAGMAIKRAAK